MRTRSSTAKRLLKLIAGISLMTLCAAPSVFAAPPNTAILPTFANEVLTPASQAGFAWQNVAPNALASYYTYQPLTNADALLAGFPAICGVAGVDVGSTADCYIISAQQVVQPMSLNFLNLPGVSAVSGANAFPGPGLIKGDGFTPFVDNTTVNTVLASAAAGNLTKVWAYGSGGTGWKPYYQSALTPGPVLSRGNAPAAFAATPINLFTDHTYGDPAATGIWHFPAPSFKGHGQGVGTRPVLVLWLNNLPNVKPVGIDPTVDCGDNALFCYPYNRIVTHVHGAHVGPESDGLAVSWYTPNFALNGEGAFTTAGVYNYTYTLTAGSTALVPANLVGKPIYLYPMTQEAGTIWYHDHSVGSTHNNTDQGMAGFFPVTDAVEIALQTGAPPVLPSPVTTGTSSYELGFALQDRHFDINGQIIMPGVASYDKNDPNCVFDINANALPGTCARTNWMKKIDPFNALTNPVPAVHLVPYPATPALVAAAPELNNPADPSYAFNKPVGCQVNVTNAFENVAGVDPNTGARVPFIQCAPFPATSSTLEYFGNMPVVNGVTYAVYDVDPTVYRMRFIGGTDSRTFIPQLVKQNGLGTVASPFTDALPSMLTCGGGAAPAGCAVYDPANILSFFQIGSDQGLLTNMVERTELDIMGGERVDVLVDFTGLGGQTITMKNLGDDAPYSGRFDFNNIATRQPTSIDIPEIMKFRVKAAVVPASAQTPVNLKVLKGAYPTVNPTKTRTIALIEITDQYGRTMPTIDARGYVPPGIRTTEVILLGASEQWDIVNTTVDAHPMHLHQVAFQAIDRQAIAIDPVTGAALPSGFMAGANYTFGAELTNNTTTAARQASVFTPSQYIVAPGSVSLPVAAYDNGLKDTIQCPPGYVTRVKALFDIIGDYVWHCHILSHEEHDMMRPFRVTPTLALVAPTSVGVTLANGVATVTVLPAQVAPKQAVVQYRKVGATFWNTNASSAGVQTVDLTAAGPGSYEFRAQFIEPAIQNVHANTAPDSAFTAAVAPVNYVPITPAAGTMLAGATQTFTFSNAAAVPSQIWAGSTLGGNQYGMWPPALTTTTTATVFGLPVNGSVVYIRLMQYVNNVWTFVDYTYTAYSTPLPATMVSPANLSVLPAGTTQTFTFSNPRALSTQIWVGTTLGGSQVGMFPQQLTTGTTATAFGVPAGTIFVRLYSYINNVWQFNDYQYTH